MNLGARIGAIQSYFPTGRLSNADLSREFPEYSEDEVYRLSGIKNRYVRAPGQTPADLGVACAEQLFARHPELRERIDAVMFCACILEYVAPATACVVHEQLGLRKDAAAFDVPMGCSGFTNGLALAKAMVESGQARTVLLITAETPTAVIHPEDFYLRVLFSDAACCTVIEQAEAPGVGTFCFGTDGAGAENLIVPRGGARAPIDQDWLADYAAVGGMPCGRMEMKGDKILQFALREVPPAVAEILRLNEATVDDVDWFVFHHASGVILRFLARKLKIPPSKVYSVIESVGNTVSPSIPIALHSGLENRQIRPGQRVLVVGFGIGFSWSGTLLTV